MEKRSNGLGTAGFVLSLLGLIFCWVPILDFILVFLGFLFSFIALFKRNATKGLAVAGLILSLVAAALVAVLVVLGVAAFGL